MNNLINILELVMSNYAYFPSIERLENIYCVISEKVDGTNGLNT